MKIHSLQDLLVVKLQALYDIEQAIVKALPKMAKNADDTDLVAGLTEHLGETKAQVERLEKAFEILGEKPKKMKSEGIRGIIEDGESMMKLDLDGAVLDSAIIAAAQRVEHYEMAGYLSAISWADMLGFDDVVALLEETLEEEEMADEKLSELAENKINIKAMPASEEEGEEEEEIEEELDEDK